MLQSSELRLAVLIDADNIPYKSLKRIMEEIALYGTPTVKRIYGDFSRQQLSGWKNELLECAITPVQHFGYTTGKNSTDSAMVIDAMDILYEGKVDGFCIVSSDSDFTRLVMRLRESGVKVYGFGEKKTPSPFIVACDKFVYIEVLEDKQSYEHQPEYSADERGGERAADSHSVPAAEEAKVLPVKIVEMIISSIRDICDEDGWAFLGTLGSLLIKKQPDFDPRNFGFRSLAPLVEAIPVLETDARRTVGSSAKHIYVREKRFSTKNTVRKYQSK